MALAEQVLYIPEWRLNLLQHMDFRRGGQSDSPFPGRDVKISLPASIDRRLPQSSLQVVP